MRGTGEWGAVRPVVRWAGHPGTSGAVLVLLVNDHVAKRLWPGAVTGKVSDLAWMLVSPVVLALLLTPLPRLRGDRPAIAGLAVTAVMFTVAKSGEAGGELASTVWSWSGVPSRIQGDRSDLLALPALGVSWWLWKRSRATRRPRRWAALLGVPLAVVAMVATSKIGEPPRPVLWHAGARAILDTEAGRWASQDGGATWTEEKRSGDVEKSRRNSRPQDGHCLEGEPGPCFRLLDSTSPIEISEDGGRTWRAAFDPGPPWRDEPLPPPTPSPTGVDGEPVDPAVPSPAVPSPAVPAPGAEPTGGRAGYPADLFIVPAPEGWAVLAHYPGGGLVRGTPDGTWSRRSYPVHQAIVVPEQPRRPALGLPVALTAGFAGVLAATGARLLVAAGPAGRSRELLLLLLRQGICLLWVRLAAYLCGGALFWKVPGVLPASVLTVGLLPMLWFLRRGPAPTGRAVPVLAVLGSGAAAVALIPYVHWAAHRLAAWSDASDQAFLWALAATAAGAAVGAAVGALGRPARRPRRV
ncbi:hypothetical protein OG618_34505 [Kitasatospora sp. NBC_01246]|uniref:hypothetical protein n=1 Tax=Kitasatospora sp. NBC_01246 TaxID=2903570 RepID=UPI002E327DF9|nr:hypothetical protein [Kitasatospora sp. NBC_01246]